LDPIYESGTVGLRMRGGYAPNNVLSAGNAYFDNLKIYSVEKAEVKPAEVLVHEKAEPIDTSALTEIYRNSFDSDDSLSDFTAYRGEWTVFGGKLYLSAMSNVSFGQSFLLYTKDKALTELCDYVIDIDVYNVQTQGGIAGRVDLPNFTGTSDDGILGYVGYLSFSGKIPVLGYGKADGTWGGNLANGGDLIAPGSNVHLQMAFKGDVVQLTVTDIESGNLIWQYAERVELWEKGTFGFRVYGKVRDGLDNINAVSYDNLVISTFKDPNEKTAVKLTIGQNIGYVNGVEKALDASPIIRESRTMLPVRFVAEAFGATVAWDGATSTAIIKNDEVEIKITIGAKEAVVNGKIIALDVPAFIENSRTYMPVRFIAENLGATVTWDGATSTATLLK
ncbi:MAG: copper amine oxidase N-terminal domain-containing protein, partial [Clostridia bacterium]|nr:copper amine oxidase N-terminal domain-containing protein [Clostridia bacterium]